MPRATRITIQNKAKETVTATSEFAELGMKAALAALHFRQLDPDGNHKIDHVDLAKPFARIKGVTAEQAYKIAHHIIESADADYAKRLSKLEHMQQSALGALGGCKPSSRYAPSTSPVRNESGLDFAAYMTCIEGDAIAFQTFLDTLPMPKNVDSVLLRRIRRHFAKSQADSATTRPAAPADYSRLPPTAKRKGKGAQVVPVTVMVVKNDDPAASCVTRVEMEKVAGGAT